MGGKSDIEWTDATWNPMAGCSVKSPACKHCYAMKMAGRLAAMGQAKYAGTTIKTKAGFVFTGTVNLDEGALAKPGEWKRGRRIFVNSMSDLFHENVPDAWVDRVVYEMATLPRHTFQVLTKRPARMRAYLCALRDGRKLDLGADVTLSLPAPLPNVWWGVTVEDQRRAEERIPHLLATPAAVRFLSCEPLLGPIDLESAWHGESALDAECWGECAWCTNDKPPLHNCRRGLQSDAVADKGRSGLDWVIAGGESGPGARPMQPWWLQSLRDQCQSAEVPFFFKQWGAWLVAERINGAHGPFYRFPDGDVFNVVHEHQDIVAAVAEEHHGKPREIWAGYWASGDGHLAKRAAMTRIGRTLDGIEHNAFPEVRP